MKLSKKILAVVLTVLMAISMMPFTVFAAPPGSNTSGTDIGGSGGISIGGGSTDVGEEPYLTFTGTDSFSIKTNNSAKNWNGTLEYSTDANTWTTWEGTSEISSDNNVLYLRGTGNRQITGDSSSRNWVITTQGTVACSGDIRTLLDYTEPESSSMGDYCFAYLFKDCTSLTTAPELWATTLRRYCYSYMFSGCTSLTTAPELPATSLERDCYSYMFDGCTSLTTAPELPATSLTNYCYRNMFSGCTSLTTAPDLPATLLVYACYYSMFEGCANLTTAPELPATSLAYNCYQNMFKGCTSLTTAPALPATALTRYCYYNMFNGCANLTTAPELWATTLADFCYYQMFYGCTSLTTPSELWATDLENNCYSGMFQGCTGIKLSTEKTGEYSVPYSIPKEGTAESVGNNALTDMFTGTGGTFTGTPTINTTYYIAAPAPVYTDGFLVNGTDHYDTLHEAVAGASSGDTITVLSDRTMETTDIEITKNLTIDFGEYTLTASRWPIINRANLTLTGTTGGVVSARGLFDNYGTLTINGGVYNNTAVPNPAIWNNSTGVTIINGGTITSNNAAVYNEGGTLTINDGTLISNSSSLVSGAYSYAVRNLPGSTCTMNGGTVNGVHGGIAVFGDGESTTTVVINDGTVTTHNSELGNDAYYPLYISGNGTSMTVNGGTFSGPRSAVVLDDDDIGLTENTTLTITGGTFTAPSGVAAVTRGQNDSYPAISGGSYSSVVPAEYCADGFVPVTTPNAQGKYEVAQPHNGTNITVADTISENFYLDGETYGENAYIALNYNHNSNVSATADFETDVVAMNSLDELSSGDYAGNRIVSVIQAPAQATEDITITVYRSEADALAGENAIDTINYNVYDYCKTILDGDYGADLKELAETTLDYAAAAQIYFNYNTDNMATKDNGNAFYNEVAAADLSGVTGIVKPACVKSATMVAKSDLEINLLSLDPISVNDYSMEGNSGKDRFTVSDKVNGDYYEINIKGIVPANMNKTITVNTTEGEIVLSANSIMKVVARSSNANLANLAKAMYLYGAAAYSYFGA